MWEADWGGDDRVVQTGCARWVGQPWCRVDVFGGSVLGGTAGRARLGGADWEREAGDGWGRLCGCCAGEAGWSCGPA